MWLVQNKRMQSRGHSKNYTHRINFICMRTQIARAVSQKKARTPYWNFCGICQERSRDASGNIISLYNADTHICCINVKSGESSAGVKFSHRILRCVRRARISRRRRHGKRGSRAHTLSPLDFYALVHSKCHNYCMRAEWRPDFGWKRVQKLSILSVLSLGCRFPRLIRRYIYGNKSTFPLLIARFNHCSLHFKTKVIKKCQMNNLQRNSD